MRKYPAIPEPSQDPRSLQNTLLAVKEVVETLTNQRGSSPYPTWEDLVRLGLVKQEDVPR